MNAWKEAFLEGLKPETPLTVSEWATKYRLLSSKASAEPGKYRVERTPFLREPMDLLSSQGEVQRVVLMFASQCGKTELGMNFLGWIVDHSPSSALCVQPTIEMSRRLSKQRLESMFTETPCLASKIAPARSRDSGNTMFSKEFPGGILLITGANSATGLRSAPIRYLFMDEIDAFPSDIEGEGDPCALAEKRTTTFARKKILLTSTPTVKDFSRIEQEYLSSSQKRYFLPCPLCGHMQHLQFKNLKYEDNDPSTVQYQCEKCEGKFKEVHKTSMLRQGEWRDTAESQDNKTAGFHLNGLYSPLGWFSWENMVQEFIKAKSDAPLLRTFVNTRLAETWDSDHVSPVSVEGLLKRCEGYLPGQIPEGVQTITIGVDVQGGGGMGGENQRLEVSIWGWNLTPDRFEEAWLIDHQVILGDPHQAHVWSVLDVLVTAEYEMPVPGNPEKKINLKPDCVVVDSGGLATQASYQYCRERQAQGVIAIKGTNQARKPVIGRGSKVDINAKGRSLKKALTLYLMGGDTAKDALMGRLKHNEPGPGYLHFHAQTTEEYFRQLTAERQILKTNRSGFQVPTWTLKPGTRNEALDCLCMAYCGLNRLYMIYPRAKIGEIFNKRLLNPTNSSGKNKLNLRNSATPTKGYVNQW
jgi:phage terminase large subunit GpA-like protein